MAAVEEERVSLVLVVVLRVVVVDVRSDAVRVLRKAPRRGLVRILRGISSKIEEKVSL